MSKLAKNGIKEIFIKRKKYNYHLLAGFTVSPLFLDGTIVSIGAIVSAIGAS